MSTLKVNKIENTATTDGGVAIDSSGHLTLDGIPFPASGPLSHRNLLINGEMMIDQRNVGGTSTTGQWPLDHWQLGFGFSGTSIAVSAQQSSDAPEGFMKSVFLNVSTNGAIAANQFWHFQQWIEADNMQNLMFGTSNAKDVTLSFYVKCSTVGTYSAILVNGATNRSHVKEYTITANDAGNWVRKIITFPGDTSGSWPAGNGRGLGVRFGFTCGDDYDAQLDTWVVANPVGGPNQTNLSTISGGNVRLTGIQLEVGNSATPYEHRFKQDELRQCQRYYEKRKIFNGNLGQMVCTTGYGGASAMPPSVNFHVTKRAAPSISYVQSGVTNYFHSTANTWIQNGGLAHWSSDEDWVHSYVAVNASGIGFLVRANTGASYVEATSEL